MLIGDGAQFELTDQNIQHDLLHLRFPAPQGGNRVEDRTCPAGVNAGLHRGCVYCPDAVASTGICMSMHDFSRQ